MKLQIMPMKICVLSILMTIGVIIAADFSVFAEDAVQGGEEVRAVRKIQVQTYEAVGTVKPISEIRIEAQVNAQVKSVLVQPGSRVTRGQVLVTLDNRQAASRLDGAKASLRQAMAMRKQAVQAMAAAKASYTEAHLQYKRVKEYYASHAATKRELEKAESAHAQATAELNRAKQSLAAADSGIRQAKELVAQATVGEGFYQIKAPVDGEVIQRMVEPGDLALPGKPLMALRTQAGFRMEAHVREGLIRSISPGMELGAKITSLGTTCKAVVEEIVPYADPATRTFLVKAVLPDIQGMYPGMYGKLLIPEGKQQVVLIPKQAVMYAGQLELVQVKKGDGWGLRYVKTGAEVKDSSDPESGILVEVLSGLSGNEILALPKSQEQGEKYQTQGEN